MRTTLICLALTTLACEASPQSINVFGPSTQKNVEAKDMRIMGPLTFDTLTVQDSLDVMGAVEGDDGKFGKVSIAGSAHLTHTIMKDLKLSGAGDLEHCQVTDAGHISGSGNLKDVTAGHLTVQGSLTFTKLHVAHDLVIDGSLEGESGEVKNLEVKGAADIKDFKVTGKSHIYGDITAHDSHFTSMVVTSKKIQLHKTTLTQLEVKRDHKDQDQILELSDSTIEGTVHFHSGKGKIILKGKSEIKGKISGGVVENKP